VHVSLSHTYTKLHYIYSTAYLFYAVNSFTNNITQCLCIILVLRRRAEQQPAESCLLVTHCATCFSWASQLSLVSDGTPGESTPVDSYRLLSTWRLIGGGGWQRFRGLPGSNRILPYFDDLEHNHQLTQNTQNTMHACFRSCLSSRSNITWLPDLQLASCLIYSQP